MAVVETTCDVSCGDHMRWQLWGPHVMVIVGTPCDATVRTTYDGSCREHAMSVVGTTVYDGSCGDQI
jgi:hypothetical protein